MIISVDYIRRYRQIAGNIDDARMEIYIREAQVLDIMPAIGAELVTRYGQIGPLIIDCLPPVQQDGTGGDIRPDYEGELTHEEYKLLCGGFWTSGCGELRHFEGIRTALAYFAYARFVRNHSAQVTPYGVVTKDADDSLPASPQTIASLASDAVKIAEEHLRAAMEYWHHVKESCECGAERKRAKRHFVSVGD